MIRDRYGIQIHDAKIEWTPEILAQIPDDLLFSERQRRRARQRTTYTGGVYWVKHNPDVPQCRCRKCMARREKAKQKALPLKKGKA